MLRASLAALLLASPAQALVLEPGTKVSSFSRSDSGRADIFRGAGTRIPGWTPGFVGDVVGTADGVYLGSVDEVYVRDHICRVLVVGVSEATQAALGLHADHLYITLPWHLDHSDGQVIVPLTAAQAAHRF